MVSIEGPERECEFPTPGNRCVGRPPTAPRSAGRFLSGVPVVGSLSSYPEQPRWGPLDMSARPSIPVCEIPGCGKPAAVVMRAPAEVPGKEHQLCPAHASWIALRLGRVGVTYTSRPLAAA
jgi:hypothetical protein